MWDDDEQLTPEQEAELPYARYMAAGFRVVPLHRIVEYGGGALSCGCGNPECKALGKHPVAGAWQHTPVWDAEQVEAMRMMGQLYPAVGVLVTGWLIVDVDERNGGHESLERLESSIGVSIRGAARFVVRTGSGGESAHYYFKRPENDGLNYRQNLPEFPGLDFKTSGFVVGYGSPHVSGLQYKLLSGSPADVGPIPAALSSKLAQRSTFDAVVGGVVREMPASELSAIVDAVHVERLTYSEWIECGMALHHTTGGSDAGLALWVHMSSKDAARYKPGDCDHRWHGFGKTARHVTVGTLMMHAKAHGYCESVTFESDAEFDEPAPGPASIVDMAAGIKPWDLPGFAGRLYRWIEGQCLYAKPTISAGATLYALSCIGGMRHRDARDGLGLNLMVFSVAGSGTGKEAVFQAVTKLLSAVKISQAMHGKIKSEQEIYRNLLRHQAAYYLVDEIGIMLQKIAQASKSGGAVYLTGVIGALMEIYSKACGILTITGDLKEEIKTGIKDQIARVNKKIDAGDGNISDLEADIAQLTQQFKDAEMGIMEPYLSLMGTTTPETFDASVTPENVKNGFVARALILRESDTNPRKKDGFAKPALDDTLVMRLCSMHYGGNSDAQGARVERQGEFVEVTTSAGASALLEAAYERFWALGEVHRESTGMEAITRRSWEMCSKISLILAMADGGHRTEEHVLYGFAMADEDTRTKIRYARANDEQDTGKDTQRVMAMLSPDTWTPRWKVNRALKTTAAGCQQMIDALVLAGRVLVETRKGKRQEAEFLKLA